MASGAAFHVACPYTGKALCHCALAEPSCQTELSSTSTLWKIWCEASKQGFSNPWRPSGAPVLVPQLYLSRSVIEQDLEGVSVKEATLKLKQAEKSAQHAVTKAARLSAAVGMPYTAPAGMTSPTVDPGDQQPKTAEALSAQLSELQALMLAKDSEEKELEVKKQRLAHNHRQELEAAMSHQQLATKTVSGLQSQLQKETAALEHLERTRLQRQRELEHLCAQKIEEERRHMLEKQQEEERRVRLAQEQEKALAAKRKLALQTLQAVQEDAPIIGRLPDRSTGRKDLASQHMEGDLGELTRLSKQVAEGRGRPGMEPNSSRGRPERAQPSGEQRFRGAGGRGAGRHPPGRNKRRYSDLTDDEETEDEEEPSPRDDDDEEWGRPRRRRTSRTSGDKKEGPKFHPAAGERPPGAVAGPVLGALQSLNKLATEAAKNKVKTMSAGSPPGVTSPRPRGRPPGSGASAQVPPVRPFNKGKQLVSPRELGPGLRDRWLQLYWPDDHKWYDGRVEEVDPKTLTAVIVYEDESREADLNLKELATKGELAWADGPVDDQEDAPPHQGARGQTRGGHVRGDKDGGTSGLPSRGRPPVLGKSLPSLPHVHQERQPHPAGRKRKDGAPSEVEHMHKKVKPHDSSLGPIKVPGYRGAGPGPRGPSVPVAKGTKEVTPSGPQDTDGGSGSSALRKLLRMGQRAVGTRVEYYWPEEDQWVTGRVVATGPTSLTLEYLHGPTEELGLEDEQYLRLLV